LLWSAAGILRSRSSLVVVRFSLLAPARPKRALTLDRVG
jgi:hypothetical protein